MMFMAIQLKIMISLCRQEQVKASRLEDLMVACVVIECIIVTVLVWLMIVKLAL